MVGFPHSIGGNLGLRRPICLRGNLRFQHLIYLGEGQFSTPHFCWGRSNFDTLFILGGGQISTSYLFGGKLTFRHLIYIEGEVKFRHLIYLGGLSILDTLFIWGGGQFSTPYLFGGHGVIYLKFRAPQIHKPSGFCCKIEISGTKGLYFRPFILGA